MLGQAADGDVGGGLAVNRHAARIHSQNRTLPSHADTSSGQNACRYLPTSTFSVSVPVCTEKSMNFW
jgi:hypothetical protein